jgi:hypothetical protein
MNLDPEISTDMKRLGASIARADAAQRERMIKRYDLAVAAREAGFKYSDINQALGVKNIQATLNQGRPAPLK